jgi:16S rRNA (guanine966-N2)-methyltransferase
MRIIAGKHRGRKLFSPSDNGVRPTAARMRESIFNILNNMGILEDAMVVDLCCGTGALGIEALSRGAKKVVFIDGSNQHLKLAWENISSLGEQEKSVMIRAAAEALPKAREQFNLLFIDPPYFKGIVDKALVSLLENDWLEKGAIIVIEMSKKEDVSFSLEHFQEIDQRLYGNSKIILLERI